MIPEHLEILTVKQLNVYARQLAVIGWHDMRKAELISAIKKHARKVVSKKQTVGKMGKHTAKKAVAKASPSHKKKKATVINKKTVTLHAESKKKKSSQKSETVVTTKKTPASRHVTGKAISSVKQQVAPTKTKVPATKVAVQSKVSTHSKPQNKPKYEPIVIVEDHDGPTSHRFAQKENLVRSRELGGVVFDGDHLDRLVLVARDPFWLQAMWELNIKLVERAKAAMGVEWHTAVPILRLFRIISDGISKQRRVHVRDVYPRGHVNNWYLDVQNPSACFFVEIGYISAKGRFFSLASSNTVETPGDNGFSHFGSTDSQHFDLPQESQRHFVLGGGQKPERYVRKDTFEDHEKRSVPTPLFARFGDGPIESVKVELDVDVVIYGKTLPDAQLTIKNEPVRLQSDGKFTFRFQLPEKRQVYPIVAVSSDGIESQTTILAIERNTKALETVFREHDEIE